MKDLNFVNLNGKSSYSSPIGVAQVDDHFLASIEKNHRGIAIADDDNYASFFDLGLSRHSKKIKHLCPEKVKKHLTVFAVNVSVIDDVTVPRLMGHQKNPNSFIEKLIKSDDRRFAYKANLKSFEDGNIQDILKRSQKGNKHRCDKIILIAYNSKGHSNLCKIVKESSLPKNLYNGKRIPLSRIIELSDGLYAMIGGVKTAAQRLIKDRQVEQLCTLLEILNQNFKKVIYEIQFQQNSLIYDTDIERYVERMPFDIDIQGATNKFLYDYAGKMDRSHNLVITQSACLPHDDFKMCQDVMINSFKIPLPLFPESLSYLTPGDMWEKFHGMYPEYGEDDFCRWCENSYQIALECSSVMVDKSVKLVKIPTALTASNPIVLSDDFYQYLQDHNISSKEDQHLATTILKWHLFDKRPIENTTEFGSTFSKVKNIGKFIDQQKTLHNQTNIETADSIVENWVKIYPDNINLKKVYRAFLARLSVKSLIRAIILKNNIALSDPKVIERLFLELRVICLNGIYELEHYFMNFLLALELGQAIGKTTGLGRGSGVGSLVNYGLGITAIDPLHWDLFFERFIVQERIGVVHLINQEDFDHFKKIYRYDCDYQEHFLELLATIKTHPMYQELKDNSSLTKELFFVECNNQYAKYLMELKGDNQTPNQNNSMLIYLLNKGCMPTEEVGTTYGQLPDIDFDSNYRDEICKFKQKLFGAEYTCHIGTYSSLGPKSALHEIMRGHLSHQDIIKACKELDKNSPMTDNDGSIVEDDLSFFYRVCESSPFLKKIIASNDSFKKSFQFVLGQYKNLGVHAGGHIVSPVRIDHYIPLEWNEKKGGLVSQLTKEKVEAMGFVKDDFLGLSALSMIEHTLEMIKENHNISYTLKEIIQKDHAPVLNKFTQGEVIGIFQFDTDTVAPTLPKIKKFKRHYLPMLTSAFRPGPMGAGIHKELIDLINGVKEANCLHPSLKDILAPTFGTIIYQEQIIAIAKIIGGLDGFEADDLRRGMGKKKMEAIAPYQHKFINNAISEWGYSDKIAQELWQKMIYFSEYGFNKSHAVAYSETSYLQMWLSYHYPNEFKAACINKANDGNSEADRMSLKKYLNIWNQDIIPIDINYSTEKFKALASGKIAPPLTIIPGLKSMALNLSSQAPYSSFYDYIFKAKIHKFFRHKDLKLMILAGAFDSLCPNATEIISQLETYKKGGADHKIDHLAVLEYLEYIEFPPTDRDSLMMALTFRAPIPDDLYHRLKSHPKPKTLESVINWRRFIYRKSYIFKKTTLGKSVEAKDSSYQAYLKSKIAKVDFDKIHDAIFFYDDAQLKIEQHKIIGGQAIDIEAQIKEKFCFLNHILLPDRLIQIEKKCHELISDFKKNLRDSDSNSILSEVADFYKIMSEVAPDYKVASYIAQQINQMRGEIAFSKLLEILFWYHQINSINYLTKHQGICELETPLDKNDIVKIFGSVQFLEDRKISLSLADYICAHILTLLNYDKEKVVRWCQRSRIGFLDKIMSALRSIHPDKVPHFKKLFLDISKNKASLEDLEIVKKIAPFCENQNFFNLSEHEKSCFGPKNDGVMAGAVFKHSKKRKEGISEFTDKKTKEIKTLFKFFLSNKGQQVEAVTFDMRRVKLSKMHNTTNHDGQTTFTKEPVETPLVGAINDYDVVALIGSLSFQIDYEANQKMQFIIKEVVI